jgi:hypothetical protein
MTATAAPRSWTIHLDVPPPFGVEFTRPPGKRRIYPFHAMEVGHSHLTKWERGADRGAVRNRINVAVSKCKQRTGREFVISPDSQGLWVWRIA